MFKTSSKANIILSLLHAFKKRQKELIQTQGKNLPRILLKIAGQNLKHE